MCLDRFVDLKAKEIIGYKVFHHRLKSEGWEREGLFAPFCETGPYTPDKLYRDRPRGYYKVISALTILKEWSHYEKGFHFFFREGDAIKVFDLDNRRNFELWLCSFSNLTAIGEQGGTDRSSVPAAAAKNMKLMRRIR